MKLDLKTTDDKALAEIDDAIGAEQLRREFLTGPVGDCLRALSDEQLLALGDDVDTEVERRAKNLRDINAAHDIEQTEAALEAAPERTESDRARMFRYRVAQLYKLTTLNAPEVILARCLQGVLKVRPKPYD